MRLFCSEKKRINNKTYRFPTRILKYSAFWNGLCSISGYPIQTKRTVLAYPLNDNSFTSHHFNSPHLTSHVNLSSPLSHPSRSQPDTASQSVRVDQTCPSSIHSPTHPRPQYCRGDVGPPVNPRGPTGTELMHILPEFYRNTSSYGQLRDGGIVVMVVVV